MRNNINCFLSFEDNERNCSISFLVNQVTSKITYRLQSCQYIIKKYLMSFETISKCIIGECTRARTPTHTHTHKISIKFPQKMYHLHAWQSVQCKLSSLEDMYPLGRLPAQVIIQSEEGLEMGMVLFVTLDDIVNMHTR